jgi:hypothetical protein
MSKRILNEFFGIKFLCNHTLSFLQINSNELANSFFWHSYTI